MAVRQNVSLATLLMEVRAAFGHGNSVDLHDAMTNDRSGIYTICTYNGVMFAILPVYECEHSRSDNLFIMLYTVDLAVIRLRYDGTLWVASAMTSGSRRVHRVVTLYGFACLVCRLGTLVRLANKKSRKTLVLACCLAKHVPVELMSIVMDYVTDAMSIVIVR